MTAVGKIIVPVWYIPSSKRICLDSGGKQVRDSLRFDEAASNVVILLLGPGTNPLIEFIPICVAFQFRYLPPVSAYGLDSARRVEGERNLVR